MVPPNIPSRRRLLQAGTLSVLAAAISSAFAAPGRCGITGRATEGPFYVRNAPALTHINRLGTPGTPMRIGGTVLGGPDGLQPLPDTVVEIWHCDAGGDYHPSGSGDVSGYPVEAINLRGMSLTDERGRFEFESIVPGHYGSRRRHVHWKFAAPGHRPLTTQSYWREEKDSARARSDFTDRNTEDCRWVSFATAPDGASVGEFDVVLEPLA